MADNLDILVAITNRDPESETQPFPRKKKVGIGIDERNFTGNGKSRSRAHKIGFRYHDINRISREKLL
jgi:hypothetical protein